MCNNCINEQLQAENAELRLQVSALTQALETQNRENQPYIKELEQESATYRQALERVLLQIEYGPYRFTPGFIESVANTMAHYKIASVVNHQTKSIGLYIDKPNATGGDKPEQE